MPCFTESGSSVSPFAKAPFPNAPFPARKQKVLLLPPAPGIIGRRRFRNAVDVYIPPVCDDRHPHAIYQDVFLGIEMHIYTGANAKTMTRLADRRQAIEFLLHHAKHSRHSSSLGTGSLRVSYPQGRLLSRRAMAQQREVSSPSGEGADDAVSSGFRHADSHPPQTHYYTPLQRGVEAVSISARHFASGQFPLE